MWRGFKLQNLKFTDKSYQTGLRLFIEQKIHVETSLKNFIDKDSILDGSEIQASWFPQIDTDIFISHSHNDKDTAIALAGWLWDNFSLKCFIDSLIWGYADDLLKEIDNLYCMNNDKSFYDYHKRNYSTSHVHMMLSTALVMMIDKTECLFFLDTPSSICPIEEIKKTQSAWIYFEIATTKFLEKKPPERQLLEGTRVFSKKDTLLKSLEIKYKLELDHLNQINSELLNKWRQQNSISSEYPLDLLYKLSPPKKISDSLQS